VLPLLCALFQSRDLGCSIPTVFSRLPRRVTHAGLLDNFPAERGRQMVARFAPSDPQLVEIDFNSDGVKVTDAAGKRQSYSAQQPLAQEMEQKRRNFAQFFSTRDGFGSVQRINSLDGLRVWFEGGDIVHIRPSGNAPQLRAYSNSNTPKRAEQIVRLCIAEPNGLFRQIEADIKGHRD
jgi:phosphomannomutase